MQNSTLPPEVIEYCQRCSKRDGLSIVAYCCYLSLADRTIKAAEASTVNAIAEQFDISPAKTVWIGRKVRRGILKIKRPQSTDARKLLFFLSLRLAGTDFEMDEREEKAIEHLAKKLKLPSELATRQIAKLKNLRPPRSKTSPANLSDADTDAVLHAQVPLCKADTWCVGILLCDLLGLSPADIWAVKQGNGGVTVIDLSVDQGQPAMVVERVAEYQQL